LIKLTVGWKIYIPNLVIQDIWPRR